MNGRKHPALRSLARAVALYAVVMTVALIFLRYVRFY